MKLPHLSTDEKQTHLILLLLTTVNLLLVVFVIILLAPSSQKLPKILAVSNQTPIVDFNLISPRPNSTLSGTVPLVTTLTNGPKITSAQLMVDNQKIQAVTSQKTDRLTLYWDTTKHQDGEHNIQIAVGQDNKKRSTYFASFTVQNNAARSLSER